MPGSVRPQYLYGRPMWWHNHGHKMIVGDASNTGLELVGSAARLKVQKNLERIDRVWHSFWRISWKIVHSPCGERAVGERSFEPADLCAAFEPAQPHAIGAGGEWMIERYGGEAAKQGVYIRWERFLNIPCPGTGHDGDPNISIFVSDEIRCAVLNLLSSSE